METLTAAELTRAGELFGWVYIEEPFGGSGGYSFSYWEDVDGIALASIRNDGECTVTWPGLGSALAFLRDGGLTRRRENGDYDHSLTSRVMDEIKERVGGYVFHNPLATDLPTACVVAILRAVEEGTP